MSALPELPEELARFTSTEGQHRALKMFVRDYGDARADHAINSQGVVYTVAEVRLMLDQTRKVTLEEAAKAVGGLCNSKSTDYADGYNQGTIDAEKQIKELLK